MTTTDEPKEAHMNEKVYALLETIRRTAIQVGDTAADAAYGATKKAGELLSVAKLNIRIMELNGQVNTALREVGELLYATHTGTPTDSEVLQTKLVEIDALKAEIDALNAQIGREQAGSVCPTCGAAVHEDNIFCGECGEKL